MRDAAALVKAMLEPGDIAAHFASGVFAIYLPENSSTESSSLAERICQTIAETSFNINGKLFTTTCCIGIYRASDSHETPIQMLSHADRACEAAHQKGGSQIEAVSYTHLDVYKRQIRRHAITCLESKVIEP